MCLPSGHTPHTDATIRSPNRGGRGGTCEYIHIARSIVRLGPAHATPSPSTLGKAGFGPYEIDGSIPQARIRISLYYYGTSNAPSRFEFHTCPAPRVFHTRRVCRHSIASDPLALIRQAALPARQLSSTSKGTPADLVNGSTSPHIEPAYPRKWVPIDIPLPSHSRNVRGVRHLVSRHRSGAGAVIYGQ